MNVKRQQVMAKAHEVLGGILIGSFFKRQLAGHQRHCLSYMQAGKQRQVYVSEKEVQAVRRAVRQYGRLQKLVQEISQLNLKLIKQGVDLYEPRPP